MKRIVFFCLSIPLFVFTMWGVKNVVMQETPASAISELDVREILSAMVEPGLLLKYKLTLQTHIQFNTQDSLQEEMVDISGNVEIRYYQKISEGQIVSVRIENFQAIHNHRNLNLDNAGLPEIYFLKTDDNGLSIYKERSVHELYENTCKSILLAVQQQVPNIEIILPLSWESEEVSLNGRFLVDNYLELLNDEQLQLQKHYKSLSGSQGLIVRKPSYANLNVDLVKRAMSHLEYMVQLENHTQGLNILSRNKISLSLLKASRGINIDIDMQKFTTKSRAQKVDALSPVTSDQKTEYYNKLLKGMSAEELLQKVTQINDLRNDDVGTLLNYLEAMLALDRKFATQLLQYLELSYGAENFEDQLSLIMGALASMEAKNIETDLLNYSSRYQDDEQVTQQTAFALSEIKGASKNTLSFLKNVMHSSNPNISTIGTLSLGALGRQSQHANEIRQQLVKSLEVAPHDRKLVLVAALTNTRNADNLAIFTSYMESTEEDVAAEAVFGLKHIPGEQAYQLIKKSLLQDNRKKVQQYALQALDGHIQNPDLLNLLGVYISKKPGEELIKTAMTLVAGHSYAIDKAKSILSTIKQNHSYSLSMRSYAEDLLLTM